MSAKPSGPPQRLVESLARVAKQDRIGRKLVVAPNVAAGRELLRRLSLTHGGWIGFEVTTPRPLALALGRRAMERAGLGVLDAFEEQAMLDHALDAALVSEGHGLGELSEGVGFRQKVHEAIAALRLAGLGPRQLEAARLADWRKRLFLLRVLQRYERLLTERGRADTATVLQLAIGALEDAGSLLPPPLDDAIVSLVPGLGTRGLTGRLVSALSARGARVLDTEPVLGLDVPAAILWPGRGRPGPGSTLFAPDADGAGEDGGIAIDMYRASSINEELREALRRIVERGLRWDQVELVATEPAAYGSALHALSARLGVPVSYAVGLPVGRTRTGRVMSAYLDWIEEGFQAAPIRRLLEAGDLRPPSRGGAHAPAAAALARRFRSLRIGWGRKRYRAQIREAIAAVDRLERNRHESPEGFERRREGTRTELRALRSILFPTLEATPAVPDRMGVGGAPVSPAELARGLRAFLKRVPRGEGPERAARDEVSRILERIEATLRRRTEFRAAVAILRRYLDIRVRAESVTRAGDERGAPWSSEGGSLHLSDLEHGGYTGRPATFILGMDAERIPGGEAQDPVLLDGDRRVLGSTLPTSSELLRERAFRFAALFARLRGSVTLCYTAWSAADARSVGPSPLLLQALRLARSDPALTFEDLHAELGRVHGPVPEPTRLPLDRDDVWMAALGRGGTLRAGVDAVRRAFAPLDRGLTAREARLLGTPGPTHGVIVPRPDALDPRRNPELVVSASRLEALGACPLRYLHAAVLRIRPPDDPELDPDRWLDHLRRGALLHGVYEAALREARERGLEPQDAGFEALALQKLDAWIEIVRREMPVPGEGTLARERAGLADDVRSFVRMVRQRGAPWIALELTFGLQDDDPVVLQVGGRDVRLRGAVDRVDEDLGGVRVIDYKTGRVRDYSTATGAFDGGRRLQHALYAHAVEARLGGQVVAGEYHYPTRRGENEAFAFDRLALAAVEGVLGHMLDGVAEGAFVPTNDQSDCSFCDFAEICRADRGSWGRVASPLAAWSEEHVNTGVWPALAHLKRVRTFEG